MARQAPPVRKAHPALPCRATSRPGLLPVHGAAAVLLATFLAACSSGSSPAKPQPCSLAVMVSPTTMELNVGENGTLADSVSSSGDCSSTSTSWSSSNTTVAQVSSSGQVTALAAGATSVTVTAQNSAASASSSAAVTVRAIPVASVSITPPSASLTVGDTMTLAAVPHDAAGNDLTGRAVSWSSGSPSVASVSGTGLVTALSQGTATLTATSEGQSGTATVTVTAALPQQPMLIHRWTFSEMGGAGTTLKDDIGTADGTIVDVGPNDASVGSGSVTLTGGDRSASDYVALPGGLLSSLAATTIEVWATQRSVEYWGRIFDVGVDSHGYLMMAWTWITDLQKTRFEWKGGGQTTTRDEDNSPYELGKEYQIVVAIEPVAGTPGTSRVRLYRNGQLQETFDTPHTLATLQDTAFWLGRSQYGDSTANASYDELRIYNGALSDAEVAARYNEGPVGGGTQSQASRISVTAQTTNLTWIGQTTAVQAVLLDQNGQPVTPQPTFNWTSSDPAVVTAAGDGTATAVKNGTATITASADGLSGTATLTVQQVPVKVEFTLSSGAYTMFPSGRAGLAAEAVDQGGTQLPTATTTWSSSDDLVAWIRDQDQGLDYLYVHAGKAGTATMTATTQGVSGSVDFTVTIPAECQAAPLSLSDKYLGERDFQLDASSCNVNEVYGGFLSGKTVYGDVTSFPLGPTPWYFWGDALYDVNDPSGAGRAPVLQLFDERVERDSAAFDADPGKMLASPQESTRTLYMAPSYLEGGTQDIGNGEYSLFYGLAPRDPATSQACTPMSPLNVGTADWSNGTPLKVAYSQGTSCAWSGGRAMVVPISENGPSTLGNTTFTIQWTGMSPRLSLFNWKGDLIATCRAALNTSDSCQMHDLRSGGSNNIDTRNGAYFLVVRTAQATPSGTWTLSR